MPMNKGFEAGVCENELRLPTNKKMTKAQARRLLADFLLEAAGEPDCQCVYMCALAGGLDDDDTTLRDIIRIAFRGQRRRT